MIPISESITIKVPVTASHRKQAQEFARMQPTTEKAEQVHHNVLAVLATRSYLELLDISVDLTNSYSWDLASHLTMDVADLYIPEANGRLECRLVKTGDTRIQVSQNDWNDCIGYIVVQLNDQYSEGTMLGFVKEASQETIRLQDLRSLDEFIDCLPEVVEEKSESASTGDIVNAISDWLEGVFRDIWQPTNVLPAGGIAYAGSGFRSPQSAQTQAYINQLFISQKSLPSLEANATLEAKLVHLIHHSQQEETRFKAAEVLWNIDPTNPAGGVRRVIDLGLLIEGCSLGLLGAVLIRPDGRRALMFQAYPTGQARFLPTGLKLSALDEHGNLFLEVGARTQDDRISLKLVANPGDRFSIRVSSNDVSITEPFVV